MEDNEFEEVTIISHTDQAASILPQRTAERLMKEIRMEVTQKISQTENVKMGSLQHSEASTLLDKIHPILPQLPNRMGISIARFPNKTKQQLLVGSLFNPYILDLQAIAAQQMGINSHFSYTEEDSSSDEYEVGNFADLAYWRDHILIFKNQGPVEVYDLQFNHVKTLSSQFSGKQTHSNIEIGYDRLYYLTKDKQVVSLNTEFEYKLETSIMVENFFIERGTLGLVMVDNSGVICKSQSQDKNKFCTKAGFWLSTYRLKQMYSDHFLAAADLTTSSCEFHLIDPKTLQTLDKTVLELKSHQFIGFGTLLSNFAGFRLCMRRSIEFCIFGSRENMALFGFLNKKIIQLLNFCPPTIETMLHLSGNTWLAAGKNCTMASIEVHFPDALKL